MDKLTQEQAQKLQAILDRRIVDEMVAYKKSFVDFFESYCAQKQIHMTKDTEYTFSPFELWTVEKLATTKIAMDHQVERIKNEVKVILGEFLDQVTRVTEDEES